jgi:hypothetical protein
VVETFQEVEFREWQQHPVTIRLFQYLRDRREDLKELWAGGGLSGPTIEETVIRNAAAQGATSILEDILSIENGSLNEVGK